ncbi:MAG: ABC transporter permease [Firmicutes bacterium]|nr:ABC transporter permease [Bacillota bacterium]
MKAYNVFFKVIAKNLPQIMIYVAVFILLTVFLANTYSVPQNTDFTETKVNLAFINHDPNSSLAAGLKSFLAKNANLVDIPDNTKKLQDALFFRQVEYIVKVPAGFTEKFLSGKPARIEKTTVPGSSKGIFMDNLINKYLNTVKLYTGNMDDLSQAELAGCVNRDLAQKAEVRLYHSAKQVSISEKSGFYFNFLAYSLFAILILGVCAVMMVFNHPDLKKRNLCSPVTLKNFNFQLTLGNLSYAILAWFCMILASFIMYGGYMFTAQGLLLLLNSLVFTVAALSISFLLGNILSSKAAISGASSVFSLGTSFISGVFVPQALLGETVLKIASFTPTYWYVKSNNTIVNTVKFTMENLGPVFLNMLIMIGFAVAVFMVTIVVIKQKK